MFNNKDFSQACENNKAPILEQLLVQFANQAKILEIGSGTGQHVAYFAPALPHLIWQPTDIPDNHGSINAWVEEAKCTNVLPPVPFFIGVDDWLFDDVSGVFSANTTHIMQPNEAKLMMETVAHHLPLSGIFCQYGPFNIDGKFTSHSNAQFDQSLRQRGYGGIRDIAELQQWAKPLSLLEMIQLPANNHLLVWQK
ncbi:DUF938 domain-containing protein [Aliiglaciecola lipolytica]|uniref:Methylase n=1 Tax=Aliiglaciecola lipolytica E3 TaxID=1127673 RepID=K6X5H7_9ALTE|nr:DUF938 domain-containing protein [Aliiglaciecola lipolytica]GAC15859.1 hypothetical protein GLIP_3245 [Aliiglaciecola lipolytica E3]